MQNTSWTKTASLAFGISTLILSSALTGCGQGGMQSTSGSSLTSNNNSQSNGGGSGSNSSATTAAQWQQVVAEENGLGTSTVGGSSQQLIRINATTQCLELILPLMLSGSFTPIATTSITGLPGATIGPVTLASGAEAWMISIPLNYVLHGATTNSTFATLPNGSNLPYWPSEEVDGLSINLPSRSNYTIRLYVGIKAVGVFVGIPSFTLPVTIPFDLGFNIVNSSKTANVGYFAIVPPATPYAGGVYLAAELPTSVATLLNSLMTTN